MKDENTKFITPPVLPEESHGISFIFHLVTISLTCTIIFSLIKLTVTQPTPAEELFLIQSLTPEKIKQSRNVPVTVNTGLSIYKFREFDMLTNNFVCEATLWFEFDPSLISLETVSDFYFERAEILYLSAPKTKLKDRMLLVTYDLVIKFKGELDFKFFPLDDHMLALILLNRKVSPHELIFNIDRQNFIVNARAVFFGWKQADRQVASGFIQKDLDTRDLTSVIEHPAVQFSIFYRRSGLKYALIIILPMLVFIIVMLTAFSYDPTKYFSSIMVANGASLSGLIAFRFVLENMSPRVGYFMLADYFFLVFLAVAAMLFLIGIFSLNLSMRIKKILIIIVHLLLILAFAVSVTYVLSHTYHGVNFF